MSEHRRWPLRLVLVALLVGVVMAAQLVRPAAHASSTPNALRVTTTLSSPTTTSTAPVVTTTIPSVTVTTPLTPTTVAAHTTPVVSPVRPADRHADCAFAMAPATPPTTTTTAGPTGATGTTTSTTTTTVHEKRSVGQCTILEIGDSLGNDLGWGINRLIGSTTPGLHLVQLDRSSTGLSNSWYYPWLTYLPIRLKQYRPDLVIVFLGANDQQNMDVGGHSQAFGSALWRRAYAAAVHTLVADATNSGAYVLWVGLPVMGPYGYNQGAQYLNALYQSEVPKLPGATFLPTYNLFAVNGQFSSNLVLNSATQVARSPDGIHLSVAGEDLLATYVVNQMRALYHVRLVPHGAVYRTP